MKKIIFKTVAAAIILLILTGCVREEFTDLYGFTESFTYAKLTPEDFYTEKSKDGKDCYYTVFKAEKSEILLRLLCAQNGKIDEIRIFLPKYDENVLRKQITTEDISMFIHVSASAAEAFTGFNENSVKEIFTQMSLYEKKSYSVEGELTKKKNNFYFVYLSATTGSEFIIYDTFLKEVPETEKPESKPMYGDTTKIRTETVPTK